MISLAVIVVAVCAALAAVGFRGRITTVGIDLGTTFSVVGINEGGKERIIQKPEARNIFPSIESNQENGEVLADYQAMLQLNTRPYDTIYNAKRFIGRTLDDEKLKLYAPTPVSSCRIETVQLQ